MRRVAHGVQREAWERANAALGLTYNDTPLPDGRVVSYWREGPFYDFDLDEVLALEQAASTLHRMCVEAGDHIVSRCPRRDRAVRREAYLSAECWPDTCLMSKIGIPEYVHEQVIRTWFDGDKDAWTHADKDLFGAHTHAPQGPDYSPSVYGRFDLWYAGKGSTPKLLEFNAQTPTALLESAVIQWAWLEQTGQTNDPERQWNALHERLVEAWRRNMAELRAARPWLPERPTIYFAYETSETSGEDRMNVAYLMETATQAGFPTELIAMSQIGVDEADGSVRFQRNQFDVGPQIDVIFILYPWEWLWHEEGGRPIFRNMADPTKRGTVWIEPPWTAALWSNKGLLPVLWELFGDKPEGELLLPAYFATDRPATMTSYAKKPIWSREGANIELVRDNVPLVANRQGDYGAEGFVYQELRELPSFTGLEGVCHPVLGVWMIDGEPAGLGIREGVGVDGLITRNDAHFVPHTINSHL
ncbi:glutathionylspermidine synthase [Asanoa ferruginea]|uniref:Glutathionylspermidine synthase n=1 Tax=Asanoa ferruginea TaxID=53367 RepID=A0A3D9ZDR1_9ACTN|nr:glutathionylspermidine synthase [Asanoa ferruginea]